MMMMIMKDGQVCREYVDALEEEQRKIEIFQRELPLSLEMLSWVIRSCRWQMEVDTGVYWGSERGLEACSGSGPVLEEFIPLKGNGSHLFIEEEEEEGKFCGNEGRRETCCKLDWLKSAKLWNQHEEHPSATKEMQKTPLVAGLEIKKVGGAFHPFHGDKKTSGTQEMVTSFNVETSNCREEKEGQTPRKARRCWSPELHRRFLNALQELGGCHVATPKQIRDSMKVDGLTNDEVKSHLQKYRLHTRRPNPAIQSSSGSSAAQSSQFLVAGGIWVPPPEYVAMESTSNALNAVYAPVPTLPKTLPFLVHKNKQTQRSPTGQLRWERRESLNENRAHSSSSTTASSRTSTTSPSL